MTSRDWKRTKGSELRSGGNKEIIKSKNLCNRGVEEVGMKLE